MKEVAMWILGATLTFGLIYGAYWLAKHGSYFFFYESMVQETIREMVNPEYLLP